MLFLTTKERKMRIKLLLPLLAFSALNVNAESIINHEQVRLQSRCHVDPEDDSKMYCEQYCDMFNRDGNNLKANRGWNCDDANRLDNALIDYNRDNPQNKLVSCDKGTYSTIGYHAAICEDEQVRLTMPPSIVLGDLQTWSGIDPECPSTNTQHTCPRFLIGVRIVNDQILSVSEWGTFYGSPQKWVTGPDDMSPSQLAALFEFTMTPVENIGLLTTSSSSHWEHSEWDPTPPAGGTQSQDIRFNLTACEKADASNCGTTQVTLSLGYDTN